MVTGARKSSILAGSDEKWLREISERYGLKIVGPIVPWHNKVLGYPTEICDFVLGDGSYYSPFS